MNFLLLALFLPLSASADVSMEVKNEEAKAFAAGTSVVAPGLSLECKEKSLCRIKLDAAEIYLHETAEAEAIYNALQQKEFETRSGLMKIFVDSSERLEIICSHSPAPALKEPYSCTIQIEAE